MNSNSPEKKYFYMQKGSKQRPFTMDQIKEFFLEEDTIILLLGEKEWKKIQDIEEFKDCWTPKAPLSGAIKYPLFFGEYCKKNIAVVIIFLFVIILSFLILKFTVSKEEIFHDGIHYGTIKSSTTEKIWLDRNIGAERVCESSTDEICYGEYYEWNKNFKKTDGTGVCPKGVHIPTEMELAAENIKNAKDAFEKLKIPLAGNRDYYMYGVGSYARLWSSRPSGSDARALGIDASSSGWDDIHTMNKFSLRCVQ